MKKKNKTILIVLSLIIIVLFGFNYLSAYNCVPKPGYQHCYVANNVRTDVGVQGIEKGGYYVGNAKLIWEFEGTHFYTGENVQSDYGQSGFEPIRCDQSVCTGQGVMPSEKSGSKVIANIYQKDYNKCPFFLSVYYLNPGSPTTVMSQGTLSPNGYCNEFESIKNVKSVECYEDADCLSYQLCDKSGQWYEWTCINKEIKECEQDTCDNNIYKQCINNKYVNQGEVAGKCGVVNTENGFLFTIITGISLLVAVILVLIFKRRK